MWNHVARPPPPSESAAGCSAQEWLHLECVGKEIMQAGTIRNTPGQHRYVAKNHTVKKKQQMYLYARWLQLLEEIPLERERHLEQGYDSIAKTTCVLQNKRTLSLLEVFWAFSSYETDSGHMWDMFRLDLTRNETGGCFLVRPSTSSNTWLKTDIMRLSYSLCVCTDPRGPYSWKLDQNQKRPVEAHFHCHAP